ncbi:bifunctional 2-keto-4-hydroxyglutarate aldolase/2-keto-3-deoxy-6-phosphogluconate aldolase [Lactiplantibacillus pentosus]|uniref:bifunctional 2-keto-4-hydroxyglutarate aldolase/2-keto-3-deoxy-6-phosphogluconate aldolase n=1 Tax=Lactiplantibacillus pentosus TaxID=1589 RepID=UPI001C1E9473|nr:bifunctional 2-keto-4-hydroxyglutarate aldolase/2-keto-3-deoxy-6-phosphogluconate aldolase [Lactiplantibacillus pentosus]MBU7478606.1 bifunctional 2-keto-4-hydroxyglutarate aldolase/2-keto-3-deoxy-6-phosphogluconate aldolase [Lactiplantibacillus pentosus]MBU7536408.1 bifunctional 2-keto-4-hydroxyglutarate aldolase/2-keto-3-deoxy-6-phosphogluconate aldolase [Lactiplantibacillus pentosus]MCT3275828.1 bifunctional 4-hydroxy-2-oxoglutarate aldolase/2-dehydro-3-deoxy-phosphogluconate aldolase [Lac
MAKLTKFEALNRLQQAGVVAVVRGYSEENSYQISKACINGGVTAIELAFTSPNADVTIKKLVKEFNNDDSVVIGAGTVLDPETARMAIVAGAKFIVSPSYNAGTAKTCNLYAIPYVPGCFSPTEVQSALSTGADVVKIFPGAIATKAVIPEIQGPFPYVNIMPSGGVSLENMHEWFEKGAFVVGVGGSLVGPGKDENYQQVEENAKAFHKEFEKINLTD